MTVDPVSVSESCPSGLDCRTGRTKSYRRIIGWVTGVAAIQSRWAETLTLADIAAAAGMSRSASASAFRAATGTTPMAYVVQLRLLKGRELLADRTKSVAQVAAACGHRSTEGFSRAFRRVYGQSPTASRAM